MLQLQPSQSSKQTSLPLITYGYLPKPRPFAGRWKCDGTTVQWSRMANAGFNPLGPQCGVIGLSPHHRLWLLSKTVTSRQLLAMGGDAQFASLFFSDALVSTIEAITEPSTFCHCWQHFFVCRHSSARIMVRYFGS